MGVEERERRGRGPSVVLAAGIEAKGFFSLDKKGGERAGGRNGHVAVTG